MGKVCMRYRSKENERERKRDVCAWYSSKQVKTEENNQRQSIEQHNLI